MAKINFHILSLFPKMFDGVLTSSMISRAIKNDLVSIAVIDIVKKIESKVGTGKVIYGGKEIREHENLDLFPDTTLAKKILEWQPSTDIDMGIDLTIQHYKKES